MASLSVDSIIWNSVSETYTYNFEVRWRPASEGDSINISIYNYHGKKLLGSANLDSWGTINGETWGSLEFEGVLPYFKYNIVLGSSENYINAKPHPDHYLDNYYPDYYPTMQTQWATYKDANYIYETGCCVANTLASVREKIEHDIDYNSKTRYSVGWTYGGVNRSATDEWDGMYTTDGLDFAVSIGIPSYTKLKGHVSKYPDVYLKNSKSIPTSSGTKTFYGAKTLYNQNEGNIYARHGKIQSYEEKEYWDILAIMNKVRSSRASAVIGLMLTTEFDTANRDGTGICGRLSQTSSNRGAHLMIILGWKKISDEFYWICQNSWGYTYPFTNGNWTRVGDNGLIYVPFSWHPRISNDQYTGGITEIYTIQGADYGTDKKFSWDTPKVRGGTGSLTATEWNRLTGDISEALRLRELPPYSFTRAYSGNVFTANMFNETNYVLSGYSWLNASTTQNNVKKGDTIQASHLNKLVDALNEVY